MRGLAIGCAVVLGAATRVAHAEPAPSDPAEGDAIAIFDQGRALAKAGRFREACVRFARAYELDQGLGIAVNLADCLARQGELRRAWALFDRVARNPSNAARARLARERADAIAAGRATIVVRLGAPALRGLAVRLAGHAVEPAAEIRDLCEPGDVELVASAPGRVAFRATQHAGAGATVAFDVPALPPLIDAAPTSRRRRSYLHAAGGLALASAVGLAGSLVVGLGARSDYHAARGGACAPDRIADADGYAVCTAEVAAAGVRADHATEIAVLSTMLAGAAVAVFLAAPRETVQLAPIATARELGLGISGRF